VSGWNECSRFGDGRTTHSRHGDLSIGIGYESIKYLLKQGAKVYALSRTPSKGEKAVKELNDLGYKGEAIFVQCDLADLTSVRKAADEVLAKEKEVRW
jgi:retinol dehydrogenase-12